LSYSDNDHMEISEYPDAIFSATMPSATQYDNLSGLALGRGIDAFTDKDYTTAAREFKIAISLSPYSDNALNAFEYLANALDKDGKTSEAMQTLQQAIKVFPSADGFNLSLGNLLFSEGRQEEALEQYSEAVKKNSEVSQNFYSLGQGYLALGRYNEAEDQFKKAIQISPKDSGGYYALGQTYREAGRYDESQKQLEKALAIDNNFADAHYELGRVYLEQKLNDKAQEQLNILASENEDLYLLLQNDINTNSAPKFIAAYSANLNLALGPQTTVSSLDLSLATAGAKKNYTVEFVFDKEMDVASVLNVANWSINRSTSTNTGGLYNWGMKVPSTEISISQIPVSVIYDPEILTAKVTFSISQNSSHSGTIDLSHLVFKFKGTDVYGNLMDASADEYNGISKIV
jgi:tetratricopeptide (TPR) repeat protein